MRALAYCLDTPKSPVKSLVKILPFNLAISSIFSFVIIDKSIVNQSIFNCQVIVNLHLHLHFGVGFFGGVKSFNHFGFGTAFEAGASWNQSANDDIFFQTGKRISVAANSGIDEHPSSVLERGGRKKTFARQ